MAALLGLKAMLSLSVVLGLTVMVSLNAMLSGAGARSSKPTGPCLATRIRFAQLS